MRIFVMAPRRALAAPALLTILIAAPLGAQEGRLQISGLDKLAAKAEETVDISLDGSTLKIAGRILSDKKDSESGVKRLLEGLQGIYVKSFEFSREGGYTDEDLRAVRDQLQAPGWSKLVSVTSRKEKESAEIFARMAGDQMTSLVILSAEPTELTVVNIVGPIDLDKLGELEGLFGIPRIEIEKDKLKVKQE